VVTNGANVVVSFDGPRGTREFLRSPQSGWVATVTGDASVSVSGGAGDSYFVRLKGNGYSDFVRLKGNGYSGTPQGYTDVDCT